MMNKFGNNKGISLFETLLALLITSTTLIALMTLAARSYTIITTAKVQETANQVAEKGIECLLAYRGGGRQFDDVAKLSPTPGECVKFLAEDTSPSEASINISHGANGRQEAIYKFEFGCEEYKNALNVITGQKLRAKVQAFNSADEPILTYSDFPICIEIDTYISASGPEGLYLNCPNTMPTACQ